VICRKEEKELRKLKRRRRRNYTKILKMERMLEARFK
jgi:hypothetical protein